LIAFRKARESIVVCAQQFNESKKCVGLPDFICAEVVLAFDAQKIPVKFYPVEFDTSGALQLNVGLIPFDEIRCCVVVNYFGKYHEANQTLIDECKKKGIGTVEDDTHVLLIAIEDMACDFRVDSRRKILGSRYGSVVDIASEVCSGCSKLLESGLVVSQPGLFSRVFSDIVHFLKQSLTLRLGFRMMKSGSRKLWAMQSSKFDNEIDRIVTWSVSRRYFEVRRERLRSIRPRVDLHLSKFGLLPIDEGAEHRGLVWRFWYIKTYAVELPSFIMVGGLICCELSRWPNLPPTLAEDPRLQRLADKIVSVEILRRI